MASDTITILTIAAAVLSGLMGGIYYSFSTAVMPGLNRIAAPSAITAMQGINVAVFNPLFMLAFLGPAILSVALLVAVFAGWGNASPAWTVAGSVCYLVGSIVITAAFNVPRNNALDRVSAATPEGTAYWSSYLSEWTAGNHVRAAASIIAMICFILAALRANAA